jgi:glycosyltransferase involved in cell wall biosynthesis
LCWILSRFIFAKRELKHIDFDIAHLNSSQITDWLAPCKAKGRVVMHIREPISTGTFGIRFAIFRNQMKKYCDKIIAISYDNASRIKIPEKTEVVYNFSEVSDNEIGKESYYSKKVLYLGGTAKYKGFYTMVDALKYLDEDVKVYFCGNYTIDETSSVKSTIKKIFGVGEKMKIKIKKMQLSPNALQIGMVYNVSKYFNETCCLISPFAASHFARPVIEAYLHKKPAIGTNVMGMDEIIENNKTGLIVKNNNPKALADAINTITKKPEWSIEMGEYAYRIAIEKYTNKNVSQIMRIYENLV